jgi:hypothetical protein
LQLGNAKDTIAQIQGAVGRRENEKLQRCLVAFYSDGLVRGFGSTTLAKYL